MSAAACSGRGTEGKGAAGVMPPAGTAGHSSPLSQAQVHHEGCELAAGAANSARGP